METLFFSMIILPSLTDINTTYDSIDCPEVLNQ